MRSLRELRREFKVFINLVDYSIIAGSPSKKTVQLSSKLDARKRIGD